MPSVTGTALLAVDKGSLDGLLQQALLVAARMVGTRKRPWTRPSNTTAVIVRRNTSTWKGHYELSGQVGQGREEAKGDHVAVDEDEGEDAEDGGDAGLERGPAGVRERLVQVLALAPLPLRKVERCGEGEGELGREWAVERRGRGGGWRSSGRRCERCSRC